MPSTQKNGALPCTPNRRESVTPARLLDLHLPPAPHADLSATQAAAIVRAFRDHSIEWSILGPRVAFSRDAYLRRRLFRNRQWELLLLCWLPGQHTVIHDHHQSWSITRIALGEMHETVFDWKGEGRPLRRRITRNLRAPRLTIEKIGAIHQVINQSDVPSVSIHLYSPPLTILHSYEEKTGARHAVYPEKRPDVAVGGRPVILGAEV